MLVLKIQKARASMVTMSNGTYRLWMDECPERSLADRISHAVLRFRAKTGLDANVVFLPKGEDRVIVPDVEVREDKTLLKWHMVIGHEEVQPQPHPLQSLERE